MNKIKYLYINGCSFTTDDFDDWSDDVGYDGTDYTKCRANWGFKLAEKLGIVNSMPDYITKLSKYDVNRIGNPELLSVLKYFNESRGGSSNGRIYNSTIKYLKDVDDEILENTMVVICWSFPHRFEEIIGNLFDEVGIDLGAAATRVEKWLTDSSAKYVVGLHNILESSHIMNYHYFTSSLVRDKVLEYNKFINTNNFMLDKTYHADHTLLDNPDYLQVDYVKGTGLSPTDDLHPGLKSIDIATEEVYKRILNYNG